VSDNKNPVEQLRATVRQLEAQIAQLEGAGQADSGVRKVCGCLREQWDGCPHAFYLWWQWQGTRYRFSLDKHFGRHIRSLGEARYEAVTIRRAIQEGRFVFGSPAAAVAKGAEISSVEVQGPMPFRAFADAWLAREGKRLVASRDHRYRLGRICAFALPGTLPPLTFGHKPVEHITTDDIEAYRDARRDAGKSTVTINHDLKLLRAMFGWAVRKGYRTTHPFKLGTETVIGMLKEIPRRVRFESDEDETRLLKAADSEPELKLLIVGIIDGACRPGELLTLQVSDLSLARKELLVQGAKAKDREHRIVPLSSRLVTMLEMRLEALGQLHGTPVPGALYVFGDRLGQRLKTMRGPWERVRTATGLPGLQLRDLRHEGASRLEESGMPVNYVSALLGHANLSTTSRYLNIQRRVLHREYDKAQQARAAALEVAKERQTAQSDNPESVTAAESDVPPNSRPC
jgi:integrase